MALKSGSYLTKVERTVVVWSAPDKDGDGKEVWVPRVTADGHNVGQDRAKDNAGNTMFSYRPPEGFENRPGYSHEDNYVKVDERGEVVRQPNGEAVVIHPGEAVVINADGSAEVLSDEYAQYLFEQAHDAVKKAKKGKKEEDAEKEDDD